MIEYQDTKENWTKSRRDLVGNVSGVTRREIT